MTSDRLVVATDIAEALRSRVRKGYGLSWPYARKLEIAGLEPTHSLRGYPYDGLMVLGTGLAELRFPVTASSNELIVEVGRTTTWVSANRSARGDGPPDAYLVGTDDGETPRYVGDVAEVVLGIVRRMSTAAPTLELTEDVQVGFPGSRSTNFTFVGSRQWAVHGEAIDDEFVRRAACATLAAIEAKKERDAGHIG